MPRILFLCTLIIYVSCTSKEIHPTIVIGGGLMGTSAAWQLTKRGAPVLLLEQQGETYDYGSSLGTTRIARSLGPEGDIWGELHDETVAEVEALVKEYNALFEKAISMDTIYTTSPVTYVRHRKQQERINDLMYDGQPDEYKFAGTAAEAQELFGMDIPDSTIVIREYKPHSGTINPANLIKYTHRLIRKKGNTIKYQSRVDEITKEDDLFKITYTNLSDDTAHTIYAHKVISAAGPWSGRLLQNVMPELSSLLSPQRVFLAYLKINPNEYQKLSENAKSRLLESYPLINSSLGTRMGSNFSMIEGAEDGVPIVKIGGHFQRSEIPDLAEIWKQPLSSDELKWAIDRYHQYLTFLNLPLEREAIEVHKTYSCVYTLTKNEVPYISYGMDADEQIDSTLIIMAGLSGVGGKGSLAYGRMAADLTQRVSPHSEMDRNIRERMHIQRN